MTNFDDILFRNHFLKIDIDNLCGPKKNLKKKTYQPLLKNPIISQL
jgi:hypothetical protein